MQPFYDTRIHIQLKYSGTTTTKADICLNIIMIINYRHFPEIIGYRDYKPVFRWTI